MKCMPMIRSGRRVAVAIRVMEMEDVLLARITPGRAMPSSLPKRSFFTASSSNTASTTKSACDSLPSSVVASIRASTADFSATFIFPLSTPRCRFLSMVARARSRRVRATSTMTTRRPLAAAAWAMPLPIVPEPTTPSVSTLIPPSWRPPSAALDRHRDGVASAEAEGGDPLGQASVLQRVEQRRQHPRPARADRVAESDGSAVDVVPARVDLQDAPERDLLDRERLVELVEIDVGVLPAGLLPHLPDRLLRRHHDPLGRHAARRV